MSKNQKERQRAQRKINRREEKLRVIRSANCQTIDNSSGEARHCIVSGDWKAVDNANLDFIKSFCQKEKRDESVNYHVS